MPILLFSFLQLTGSAAYQTNEKAVNEVFLQTVAVGNISFTQAQQEELETIAAACPLSDGEAVLWARALLSFVLEEPANYNDDSSCVVERSRPAEFTTSGYHEVYPNPASENVVIKYKFVEDAPQYLVMFNTLGQLVKSVRLPEGQDNIQFSIESLPAGIYWYKFIGTHRPASGKLIINH